MSRLNELLELNKKAILKKNNNKKIVELYKGYISEDNNVLEEFVNFIKESVNFKNKINLIVAPPGSGKTSAVLKELRKREIKKTITIVPKVDQVENVHLNERYEALGVRGGQDRNLAYVIKNKNEYNLDNLVMTVDQLLHLKGKEMEYIFKDYYLIVDEAHAYIENIDFRYKAISSLDFLINSDLFKGCVYITATPQPILKTDEDKNLRILKIVRHDHIKKTINFLEYPKQKRGMSLKMDLVSETSYDGISMVYMNYSKRDMEIISDNYEGVYLYTADTKFEDHHKLMIEKGLFPEDCKIAICTDTLTEGFDVTDDRIRSYHLFDEYSTTTVIQFSYRGRHIKTLNSQVYIHAYIDYQPLPPLWKDKFWEDVSSVVRRLIESYEVEDSKFVRNDIQERIIGWNYNSGRYELSSLLVKKELWRSIIRESPREVYYEEDEFIKGINKKVVIDEKDWLDELIKNKNDKEEVDMKDKKVKEKIVNFLDEWSEELPKMFALGMIKNVKNEAKRQFSEKEFNIVDKLLKEYEKTPIEIPFSVMYDYTTNREGRLEMVTSIIKKAQNIAKIGEAGKIKYILGLRTDRLVKVKTLKEELGSDYYKYLNAAYLYKKGVDSKGNDCIKITEAKPNMSVILANAGVSRSRSVKIIKYLREKYLSYESKGA